MINLSSDVSTKAKELPIDPVEDGLKKVPLSWVLAIKQLQNVQDEGLVDETLGHRCLEVW